MENFLSYAWTNGCILSGRFPMLQKILKSLKETYGDPRFRVHTAGSLTPLHMICWELDDYVGETGSENLERPGRSAH